MTCRDCRYYYEDAEFTYCRKRPPTVIQYELYYTLDVPSDKRILDTIEVHHGWPTVDPDDWCAELRERDKL